MHRFLLLASLLPLLVAIVLRKVHADRALRVAYDSELYTTAGDLARGMLAAAGNEAVDIRTRKRVWAAASVTGDGWLALPAKVAQGASAADAGMAALRVGLYLLSQRNPAAVARRQWALRFGHVFPVFTLVVCVFAMLVGKLPLLWALSILFASLGIACCAQALAVAADRQAAVLAVVLLEKKRVLHRLTEEEAVVAATRAWAWRDAVPGLVSRLM